MNGRIGTSASAGCTPPRNNAHHDSPPPTTTIGPVSFELRRRFSQKDTAIAGIISAAKLNQRQRPARIEDRQQHQAQRIVGDRQQQQERDRRVPAREDEARRHVGERDVGRARALPSRSVSSGRPNCARQAARTARRGPIMPPAAASNGTAASRGDCSGPPGRVLSTISFAASAKKKTMPISLTAKCNGPCATISYEWRSTLPISGPQPCRQSAEACCR
jgi:hypothetical protein